MSPLPESPPLPANRSMPPAAIIPELADPDVRAAADWLCRAFGFTERLRIGTHRAQLTFDTGALVVTRQPGAVSSAGGSNHSVLVRVTEVDAHCARARQAGAIILSPPTDYPFGERQYTAADLAGHHWTFSQTIADIDPADWGGTLLA